MYRQQIPELDLSIEKDTSTVPDDGKFHVVLRGAVVYSSANERRAVNKYVELKQELFEERGGPPEPRRLTTEERLERERAYRDIQSLRVESFERRAASGRKKGGRGGRGGVS